MMELKVRHLRVFEAVASCGSFSRAAEQLALTQPAVSMVVRQLEQELGTALFDPTDRKRLSDAGQELLGHARIILAQVRAAEEAMAFYTESGSTEASRGLRGLLHLGVVQTANYFAPRLLSEFHRRHPDVHLKLTVGKRSEILAMLAERRLDIAITGYPPSEADVEAHSFARHPHCIVAPVNHPLARRGALEWTDLRQEDFIFREPGSSTRLFLEQLLQAQSIQVRQRLELSGNETVKHAVMEGLGISFLSAHVFQVELEAGRIAVLDLADMPKYIDWCFIHRRDVTLNGVNQAFKDFVFAEGTRIAACLVRG
ncbi:LysR family transcriptional regulator [Hydrogenophaga taeniospiralis]|jgi:DNA-binding transcriptional LysR family regulator|uniref:LysR family transcriptional regulator n=1 Tax=Hydrogenophaga taeniospiralis TaxID=65656 RepID=UPI0008AB8976|nr:LysR family transcriptional regulator [Hydrogenophaga taeniospiralis]MCB4362900.1 LysR family transcriptional regulator [Hydrogenophaga taeniospiralis]OGB14824.1 MAG: LysR family transcriptional regulator [Burkholderiales bacterium RIFCSPLOWO2_02_FULL_67_64]OGB41552.1 MAG: LysR family transcriptional regulator [Burkholderiales bacterium RIFCSPHIGHO2_12_FULL_67_38]OGB42177.1 MAG: LysR family transcriptional regulator [Burkholderiales bacterium RIFCSPLOWO2_12_67_14]